MSESLTVGRRCFVGAAAASVAAAATSRAASANEKIGIGLVGYGLIGKRHAIDFRDQPDVNIVAVAEAHQGRLDEARAMLGGQVRGYGDFRKLLEDRDVDAIVVSTPDHWHALMTMLACAAGKDVYVEKPLTLFPREGQWMIDVANRHKRVVQVGTQQRSGPHYQRAKELIQSGRIGKVVSVRMHSYRNIMPGFGRPADGPPPAGFDWDMFLGPAPLRPYNSLRGLYHFRWFWDYSGGQMTNLGQHSLDIVDWFLGGKPLGSVASLGGRLALQDGGETPDTQDALFDFGDFTAAWSHREAALGEPAGSSLLFCGTKGSLAISRSGFTITPDKVIRPENAVPQFTDGQPVGGVQRVREPMEVRLWTEPLEDKSGNSLDQFRRHVRNFLDCIKSRQTPISDLESGHRVATTCHLANLSLRLGRSVKWDAAAETITGDDEAAKMLERTYRVPWERELKAIVG
ncbi:MAG: Gfo/Idh/MocA family oxidoreductase [Planctomycetaceae bacterium]|nr:Gfo/Idh/MocA family oxidoreductase [Planctomycetaceae bacterium]